jgi:hypothetical protein
MIASLPPLWPDSWPAPAECVSMLPHTGDHPTVVLADIMAAGELFAAAGYDPDVLLFAQAAVVAGRQFRSTAEILIEISNAAGGPG